MSTFCLLYILFNVCAVLTMTVPDTLKCQLENPAVVRFREYLQIDTSRSENLQKAVDFWKRQAEEFGLEFSVYEPAGKPICVLTWPGANASLPSIMLNTHMDVVPAVKEDWTHPPYDAVVDANGNVYGRGAQDTKDIAIQYLEAVGKIKRDNITLQRTVHLTLMPDEEIGGFQGMKVFVKTPEFAALNIGFALDEGLVSPANELYATNQDRLPWFMNFTVEGSGGHGSSMPDDLAIVKLQRLLNVLMDYRQPHVEAVKLLPYVEYGLHTTLNVNMLNGGTAPNTIPQRFHLVADLRLAPNENLTEISALVNSWMAHAGPNTTVEFLRQEKESPATPIDETNPYWVAMNDTIHQLGYKLVPVVCPATSDMIFARAAGVPAIGFAPRAYTTSRVHGVDEYLNLDIFLQGIDIYVALVKRLANVPG